MSLLHCPFSLSFPLYTDTSRHGRSGVLAALLILLVAILPGCGDDDTESNDTDTLEDTAIACPCNNECPDGLCDVRVVLESDCVGKLDEAEVIISGLVAGVVTPSTPFVSCEAYPCDTVLDMEVRGGGISTGVKSISVLLDPDIPFSCMNLP